MGINSLLFLSVLCQLLLVIFFRLSFSGRVCAGEYIDRNKQSSNIAVYLIPEGRNLLAIIILELILLPLVGYAIKLRRPHLKRMAELRQIEEDRMDSEKLLPDRGSESMKYLSNRPPHSDYQQSHASMKFSQFNDSRPQIDEGRLPTSSSNNKFSRRPQPHGRGTRAHRDQQKSSSQLSQSNGTSASVRGRGKRRG